MYRTRSVVIYGTLFDTALNLPRNAVTYGVLFDTVLKLSRPLDIGAALQRNGMLR